MPIFLMAEYGIGNYIALYVYECLITIGQEVHNIWARKWTLITWIYVFNRYSGLFALLFDFLEPTGYKVRNHIICIS
jgi:hypothetical protein